MHCNVWSFPKKWLFSAGKNCSLQEYEMLSTVKWTGVQCEKQEEGFQKNTMSRVQYSLVASNTATLIVA